MAAFAAVQGGGMKIERNTWPPVKSATFRDVLVLGERELESFAKRLDVSLSQMGPEKIEALALTNHAVDLYRAVRRECAADAAAPAMVILRSLVELALNLRWVEPDPVLRLRMWRADYLRNQLEDAQDLERLAVLRKGTSVSVFTAQQVAELEQEILLARADARAQGHKVGATRGPMLPTLADRIDVNDNASWEAYRVAYASLSGQTHVTPAAIAGYQYVARVDGAHLRPAAPMPPLGVRSLAATTFAMALEAGSKICGLGFEAKAEEVRNTVATWPAVP
jgi:hypothetical protein